MGLTFASLIITCVICYGIYYIVKWHLKRRRLYELASKFPGPPVLPIVGNAHIFVGSSEHLVYKLKELTESYPSPFRFWIGPLLIVCVTDPEHIKEVCVSPKTMGKGEVFEEFARPLFGEGLLSARVPKWRAHRRMIQPTFNAKILDSFVETFAAQSKTLNERLEKNLNGGEFEIFDLIASCLLDMICETAMGVNVGAQMNKNCQYVEAVQQVIRGFCERFFHFWLHPDFIFHRTQLGRDQHKYLKCLYSFTDDVIRMRRQELLQSGSRRNAAADNKDDVCEDSIPRKEAFLDHLIKLTYENGNLTDQDLRDEVSTMVLAGSDTSAITLDYAILMLASHPDVQEKVYQELCEIYGNSDTGEQPVTAKDLPRMKYMERVIKESMRLLPMAPFVIRSVTEDLTIGDHTIPKGCIAAIGIMRVQRSEKYWPDPLKFDPDRFLPEEVAKRHPYTFMAFSGGPRNCVGINYAMMSMKTLLATIMRRYVFKKDNIVPINDIRLKGEILMKPRDPIKIRIERRT